MASREDGELRDDSVRTPSPNSTGRCASVRLSRSLKSDEQSWNEILEQTCGEMSDATTSEMVEIANSTEAQQCVEDLLPVYFRTWQLHSTESIMVFMLLNYFILKRDCTELKSDRTSFEDHIEKLKNRVAQLEEANASLEHLRKLEDKKRRSPDNCEQSLANSCSQEDGRTVERLTQQLKELMTENRKLQRTQEEVKMVLEFIGIL